MLCLRFAQFTRRPIARSAGQRARFLLLTMIPGCLLTMCCTGNSEVELRRFPYPYEAGIAICSDIDETTFEEFLGVQRFLCTTDTTDLGPGLGLEIGNSFWCYNEYLSMLAHGDREDSVARLFLGTPDSGFGLFVGISDSLDDRAPIIADLVRSGYLDCLHSFGHFRGGAFRRALAESAVQRMIQMGLHVAVFTNHNAPQNPSNIGPGTAAPGDDPAAPEYHTDWTIDRLGVKFLWRGAVTHCVGQSGDFSLLNLGKSAYEFVITWLRETPPRFPRNNALIAPLTLDDGRVVYEFVRFFDSWGKIRRPDEGSLPHQIPPEILEELIVNHGYMILYTHLGKRAGPPGLSNQTIRAFREVKQRSDSGTLFVTTTGRLLRYYLNCRSLRWHCERQTDTVTIVLDSLVNEVEGRSIPTPDDVQGVTFYVPADQHVQLRVGAQLVDVHRNPADRHGRVSISVPWVPLRWPLGATRTAYTSWK